MKNFDAAVCTRSDTIPQRDRQTDRQTDRSRISMARVSLLMHAKCIEFSVYSVARRPMRFGRSC